MESTTKGGSVQRQESVWGSVIVEYHKNWVCSAKDNSTRNLISQKER